VDERLGAAVLNNAGWCDLVCRGHGVTTDWPEGLWVSRQPTPQFYPEAVTLHENLAPNQVIDELPVGICSVKDSFADLDLASHDFELLFEARWIYRASTADAAAPTGWTTVSAEGDFVRWREAWGLTDILPGSLLGDESVRVLQRKDALDVSAGAVLNQTGSVVGLSNLFSAYAPLDEVCGDVAALCSRHFPCCPIVGYANGQDLDAAINSGFTDLAPLRVWQQIHQRKNAGAGPGTASPNEA
jgi:hypothetical protein